MEPAHFLNVDLDVRSPSGLAVLTKAISAVAFDLREDVPHRDGWASYELLDELDTPEQVITCFCDALEQLTDHARAVWHAADSREFSIGIQSGLQPHWSQWRLSPHLLSRVAALQAGLSFEVYAPEQVENSETS